MNPKTIIALVLLGLTIAGFVFLQIRKRKKK
jgi:LPXTG-motif cell wall-anchored protein